LKIIIKPVKSFTVETQDGRKLGLFQKSSAWNGMTELRQGTDIIVVETGDDSFENILGGLFCSPETSKEVPVVKASPKMLQVLEAYRSDRT